MFSAATKTGAAKAADVNYIDDLFSTWLYSSSSGTDVTINNGIDLSTKGGMVWIKSRTRSSTNNYVLDTVRGSSNGDTKALVTNTTAAQSSGPFLDYLVFNNNGFTAKAVSGGGELGTNTYYGDMVSWTFRDQAKFFDVVTYTGNGSNRTIAHNLGSVPGCIIVKRTDTTSDWQVYHRSLANTQYMVLNTTAAAATGATRWNSTTPTSTVFSLGTDASVNASGGTYVAYLFAHNAGGFGTAGTDNVISCGSYTGDSVSAGKFIELGYEPQFVIQKEVSASGNDWHIQDIMRGAPVNSSAGRVLRPNSSVAEYDGSNFYPSSTGFFARGDDNNSGSTYIYIAIRRPMKPPTTGTSVFAPVATSASTGTTHTIGFALDLQMLNWRTGSTTYVSDRLRGVDSTTNGTAYPFLKTSSTDAEVTSVAFTRNVGNTSFQTPSFVSGLTQIYWNFRRAPGFFDIVCYTGNNVSGRTINHNLGVAPELMIVKQRSGTSNWSVYAAPRGATDVSYLNNTFEFFGDSGAWANTAPTSSVFTVGAGGDTNNGGSTFVAYLFASQAGVSKVGSYTGTGGTQTINCGFTGGARFVLIKRTDARFYSWFVWDTARGMVAGTDPRLALNTTDAEVNNNWVYTATTGFQLVTNDAQVNANGGSYIYLAIA